MRQHLGRLAQVTLIVLATAVVSAPAMAQVLSNISAISVGGSLACALTATGGVKCWGGPPGNGSPAPVLAPVDVVGLTSGVKAIAAGDSLACAVTSSGGVKCWGLNLDGGVGDGTHTDRYTPVDVVGLSSGVRTVGVGYQHACAVLDSGHVKCWGFGLLGDGNMASPLFPSPVPVDVSGISDAIAVAVTFDDTCVVHASGALSCWGSGAGGQLGTGTMGAQLLPTTIISSGVSSVAVRSGYTCAVISGSVSCWGNVDGIVGHEILIPAPVPTLGSGAAMVAVGFAACIVTTGGAVKCWGPFGGLGDGTNQPSMTPVDVSGLSSGVTQVAVGNASACALKGGQVFCWGSNGVGSVGDGTTISRLVPVAVIDPALQAVPALSPIVLALLALVVMAVGLGSMRRGLVITRRDR
jgi:hypothetical protein